MEYDFEVFYKQGLGTQVADALLRIPTDGETTINPSEDIPCFLCEPEAHQDNESLCGVLHPMNAVFDVEEHEVTTLSE